jgi:UDP-glucose-4-epimerase GalE
VIHFAGWAYASESVLFPLEYFENTVESTRVLLSAMQHANVTKLLYSSSSATYGDVVDLICDMPITETTPQVPSSPYGTAKLQSEQMIKAVYRAQKPAFSAALLRYFNVVGADASGRLGPLPRPALRKFGRIVDACFGSASSGVPLKVYGNDYPTTDGFAIRDYIHVSDIVQAHLRVLLAIMSGSYLLEYNIGINQGFSVLQVIRATEQVTGRAVPFEVLPRRFGDPSIVLGNASKLEHELGWKPVFRNFTDMILTAWRWQERTGHHASDAVPTLEVGR